MKTITTNYTDKVLSNRRGTDVSFATKLVAFLVTALIFLSTSFAFAQPASPCVETDECFEFRFFGATTLPDNNVKLKFGIRTNCSHDLSYAAFGLPNGATAVSPNGNYSANFNYSIENATNNPFRSIKFEANNASGYKNGAEDTFEFIVSAATFANMSTIKVQAKAAGKVGLVSFDLSNCNPTLPCVAPQVQVALQGSATVCLNTPVTFSANLTAGTATSYIWTVPSGWVINSGQGSATVSITPTSSSGNIRVTAANSCGSNTATVAVTAQNCGSAPTGPCVLVDECFEFRFLGATTLPNNIVKLKFEIQTNCHHDLSYAAFGLPNGATAVSPNANYSANFNYTIENATNNPFRSIKFEAKNANGYKNGADDTFEFTVSADVFANMNTIKVQAKAAGTIGTVTFDLDECNPNPVCVAPEVIIAGPDTVCLFAEDAVTFTAELTAGTATSFVWTVPADWFIMSGEGTATIEVAIGEMEGNVSVRVANECGADTYELPVAVKDCGDVIPLPVELISFNAARAQSSVLLTWATASEKNNEAFEIERSADGRTFDNIGKVAGQGTTSHGQEYNFTDARPLAQVTYYRLKQVDFDGTFKYSPVRAVERTGKQSIEPVKAFPNPTASTIKIELPAETSDDAVVTIISVTGQTVFTGTARSLSGANNQIDLSRFNAGMYILNINNNNNETQSLRITKL